MKSCVYFYLVYFLLVSNCVSAQTLPDAGFSREHFSFLSNAESSPGFYESVNSTLSEYSQLGRQVPIAVNPGMLNAFYNALKNREGKKIRIAHYGDSLIWGDIITSDLRKLFQEKFGGAGPGMLSICNDDLSVRKTVIHTFSDDWNWSSLWTRNKDRKPIGIAGTASTPGLSSWVSYDAEGQNLSCNTVRLFYSDAPPGAIVNIKCGSVIDKDISLSSDSGLQEETVHSDSYFKSVKLSFTNLTSGYFYAVSMESDEGIFVDNFALRGTSGVSLLDIESDMFKQFQSDLNYELIILNFGLNAAEAASAEKSNYKWYYKRMIKVIDYLKDTFPNTSILMVSVGDRTIKKGSRFISDPAVISMLEVQKRIAEETNIAFWNLFESMGGEDSMYRWVHNSPAYAYKDYAHFSDIGGARIAELLYGSIMKGYKSNGH